MAYICKECGEGVGVKTPIQVKCEAMKPMLFCENKQAVVSTLVAPRG